MKTNKRGISLIVLVITIIVMIVLAGAVIITLDNSGIINKANEAVINSNLKQVEQLASLAWAEAFLDENITTAEQYKEYVENKLIENKINLKDYYIEITAAGVKVEGPDTEKPTVTIVSDTESITTGKTIIFTVTFSDNKKVETVNLTENDITLNGFTATKTVVGEGNIRTITLSNVQGEPGEKSITLAAGIAKDTSGNESEEKNNIKFELQVITLGSLITSAEDYGKTINYISDNGITKWRVFYHTNEYIYLIASEELEYDKVPQKLMDTSKATISKLTTTLSDNSTRDLGKVYWTSGSLPSSAATIQNPSIWMANWNSGVYTTGNNAKCMSYLLDETIWGDFKNTTESYKSYIVGAVGSPTLEMFVASWNARRTLAVAANDTTTYNKEIGITVNGTKGYYVNNIVNGTPYNGNEYGMSISTKDDLYVWSTVSNSAIWLASPSAMDAGRIMVLYNSGIGTNDYSSQTKGLRPVVCLRSNCPANLGTTTDIAI